MGDNGLTASGSLPLWPHGLRGSLSLSENKGTLAGCGQRTRQLNGLASIGTPSLVTHCVVQTGHHLLSPTVLYKRFNRHERSRCCPKIVVSISRSLFTSGQLRHIGGIVPKTGLPLWRKNCEKREVDLISHYKWWINEELHRWSFDKPLKIVYHWYLKYLLTQTFFLVIAQWRFHSTWSTISFPKIRRKKNISWNLFPHFDAI